MKHLLICIALLSSIISYSQGLEDVIVETYYVSDANDATDTDGGSLPEGSVTYRIYIDMAPGYELQAVYGNDNHTLSILTSTFFFNNVDRGETTGNLIPANRLDENTVAVDSWLTMNAASEDHFGLLKTQDGDGSIIGGANNDGGSEGIAAGLLSNNNPAAGIPLTSADGMLEGVVPTITAIGIDMSMFADANDGTPFVVTSGAWSVLEGVQGPTAENIVLIAQITTDGEFEFHLNIQLGVPGGGVEQYVSSNPIGAEQFFNGLNYPMLPVFGCTSPTACNYDVTAEEDNGSCIEPVANCQACNADNTGLVIIDSDGDGICNAEEIVGCVDSATACNYNPAATDEEDCLEPVENCAACGPNGGLVLIDDDGDGVCNADEVAGCTDEAACNYNPAATDDDGACLIPVVNCSICNETNDALELIDSDGDGICDALENPGCLSPTACNYNPDATSDNGSCIEPIENCEVCNETNDGLVLVDTDGDGICDAQDLPGCTNVDACNYDPFALQDDGSCLVPEQDCTECNDDNTALVLLDTDGDGVCDANEVLGCTDLMACNYNEAATEEDGTCVVPIEDCYACNETNDGLIIIDGDGDGVCDGEEIFGCTDPAAINYNPDATEDDGSCITSVEEVEQSVRFSIYPNPTSGAVNISIESLNHDRFQIEVIDITGRTMLTKQVKATSGAATVNLDLSFCASGVYFVRLNGEQKTLLKKLVIK